MCAGTLAKYAAQGHKVFIATATNGNIGSAHHTMEEIGRIRKQEAANSAAIIGAEYICLDYDDEMFFEIDRETRLKFINLVRHCKADVIFTHNPHDYNPDHMLTSKIINDIAVMIPIAHLKTEELPYNVIPSIWYFDTKMKMLSCMESQKQWMADNYAQLGGDTERFYDTIRITSEFRGMQAGCKYAEGFVRALDGYRTRLTERVLP